MNSRVHYAPPARNKNAFSCPHCGAYAHQEHYCLYAGLPGITETLAEITARALTSWAGPGGEVDKGQPILSKIEPKVMHCYDLLNVSSKKCVHCYQMSIWVRDELVWPRRGAGPFPNPDLPPEVLQVYEEASSILDLSPRASCALSRLAIELLCKHVGATGKTLDNRIGCLVERGLKQKVQQMLDYVRVVGNDAVHAGQMVMTDTRADAEILLKLVNEIADEIITQPEHIDELYNTLPEEKRKAIEKRDSSNEQ